MIVSPQVPLHRLILSLSQALDYVHPDVADHQQRVAYIAIRIAREMGLYGDELFEILQAAALHDIGLVGVENRLRVLSGSVLEELGWHEEVGAELLRASPLFGSIAEIVRYHHTSWNYGRGAERNGRSVPLASHIIAIADEVERAIDRKAPILDQAKGITANICEQSGSKFLPECVDAFRDVSEIPAFWLDCVSGRIYGVLLSQVDWPMLSVNEQTLQPIAKLFARVTDAASRWTATHSSGVSATAVALAKRFNFSPRELSLMRAAGYLHDIGKLTVPTRILDKPGKLTKSEFNVIRGHTYFTYRILDTIGGMPQIIEWAAFHHERLDGTGYPFQHAEKDLTLGSRIMAVADVFTAITEDRPYRTGMKLKKAISVLETMVQEGALDGDVVARIRADADRIDESRRCEQLEYAKAQSRVNSLIDRKPKKIMSAAG